MSHNYQLNFCQIVLKCESDKYGKSSYAYNYQPLVAITCSSLERSLEWGVKVMWRGENHGKRYATAFWFQTSLSCLARANQNSHSRCTGFCVVDCIFWPFTSKFLPRSHSLSALMASVSRRAYTVTQFRILAPIVLQKLYSKGKPFYCRIVHPTQSLDGNL